MAAKVLTRVGQIIELVRSSSVDSSIELFDGGIGEPRLAVSCLDALVSSVVRHLKSCAGAAREGIWLQAGASDCT